MSSCPTSERGATDSLNNVYPMKYHQRRGEGFPKHISEQAYLKEEACCVAILSKE